MEQKTQVSIDESILGLTDQEAERQLHVALNTVSGIIVNVGRDR